MTATLVDVPPADLLTVGHVYDAYGLKGWIRVKPYSGDAQALLHAKLWWFEKSGEAPRMIEARQAKHEGADVVAQMSSVCERDGALALKGYTVSIARSDFPALDTDEFYWVDLIGLDVVNNAGTALGRVRGLMDNGAHAILQVAPEIVDGNPRQAEILIPFVGRHVRSVERAAGRIVVDWSADF